ncbi:DNA topoisomerase III [Brevibacillus laterosporus]|uniref:DNA topoisomerase III n=1 Tax=Brevibacillus laterosporus TaxID=1465 RepID=UPI000366235C|nr:DNA topoisomerase III [Brevibacillus laterosporus]ATO50299.1 DNA topoisomerase III [Brevibacillus laterosporus DSM 25]MBG9802013.1 DNA topoisomerase III [Brevibacillus laterosporus]MED2006426.1 DNA topoisomerase III [Brevibacillus laterosporus]MED4764135.1 DNA topoisomerase III [Brevibacillus laterosporus]TPH15286.1 DNA topoisomerase III [Brevibacillus laterosporus]
MSKKIVLAEKPSVGKDIARVLKCTKQGNGYLEGDKYVVTWAFGHLVTLADPEVYGETYKSWKLEDLPLLPSRLQLTVIRQSSKQYQIVKKLLGRQDVTEVIIATDAGREGELVARWILEKAHVKKPVKRLWISSVTDKAITDGFRKLRDGKEYENLYASAVARSEADWFVGINATRALTTKHNAQLSCGRVQTPTVAMIAKREEEIQKFVPRPYYGVQAITGNGLKLTWQDQQTKDMKTFTKEKAEKIVESSKNKQAEIIDIQKANKKSFAPALYDLTELQRDANKRFGFSAKETLSVMQGLYETHKVLTYPRTDSRYLTSDIVETIPDRLRAISVKPYTPFAAKLLKQPIRAGKHVVDDSKVSDHHAIIPTEQSVLMNKLSDKERKIYDLVVKRFLAVLYTPFEYEQISIRARIGDGEFLAKGKTITNQGWKEIYDNHFDEEENGDGLKEQLLPKLQQGEQMPVQTVSLTKGETKPPEPFTEATLLSAMENPVRYMGQVDKQVAKTLGDTGGLGTVATRADIIEKLFNSFLIEKRGKHIHITSKGKQLLELVPEELRSPALTAEWEMKLGAISKGSLAKNSFIQEMKKYAEQIVQQIKYSEQKFRHDNLTRSKCPDCGKLMLEVNGKKGKMLVCQDRECGHRKNVSKVTNARCPQCRKKMEMRGEGEGKIFVCKCGHREKLSAFNDRRGKEKQTNVSKRDVAQYMKKQQHDQEDIGNPALMEALKNFKLDQ